MADVTGKVVKIQLTIEYTKTDGLQATQLPSKEVTINADSIENIAALVLSRDAYQLLENQNVINQVKDDLQEEFTLDEENDKGLDGTENTKHTLCIIKTDGEILAGCSIQSHTPQWNIQ